MFHVSPMIQWQWQSILHHRVFRAKTVGLLWSYRQVQVRGSCLNSEQTHIHPQTSRGRTLLWIWILQGRIFAHNLESMVTCTVSQLFPPLIKGQVLRALEQRVRKPTKCLTLQIPGRVLTWNQPESSLHTGIVRSSSLLPRLSSTRQSCSQEPRQQAITIRDFSKQSFIVDKQKIHSL